MTCRSCFFCIPKYTSQGRMFQWGTCYQAKARVNANMSACSIFQERGKKVTVKSTPEKRNTYRDKDGNKIMGMTVPEMVDRPLTIFAKREYHWGQYSGLAVKVQGLGGSYAIVEITAPFLVKKICSPKFPKLPVDGVFQTRTSKDGNEYFVFVVNGQADQGDLKPDSEGNLPF